MNTTEIKAKLQISRLEFARVKAADGSDTPWLRHWDNDNRVAVVVHEDVIEHIKADPSCDNLALKPAKIVTPKPKTDAQGNVITTDKDGNPLPPAQPYTSHTLIAVQSIEFTV